MPRKGPPALAVDGEAAGFGNILNLIDVHAQSCPSSSMLMHLHTHKYLCLSISGRKCMQ